MSKETSDNESQKHIQVFAQKYGEEYLKLARYAAFPLVVTPELLYLIRKYFVNDAPWIAVAKILLSSLFEEVALETYEMKPHLRTELLKGLHREQLEKIGRFMLYYLNKKLIANNAFTKNLEERQKLTALAYVKPEQAATELALKLSLSVQGENIREAFRWTSFIDSLSNPLEKAGFKPLITYNNIITCYGQGDESGYQKHLQKFNRKELEDKLGLPVSLEIPAQLSQVRALPTNYQVIEIEVVTLEEEEQPEILTFSTIFVNKEGITIKSLDCQAYYYDEILKSQAQPQDLSIRMIYIPSGQYWMGSESDKDGYHNEKPQHLVTVRAFYMSQTLITQAQWQAVAALPQEAIELDPNCAGFKGNSLPVEKVSWREALEFCARISRYTGRNYRLPSEGEWEYACRAIVNPEALGEKGKKKPVYPPFHFGETLTGKLANYDATRAYQEEKAGEYRKQTTPVRIFLPNAFGLYDMHGNVLEWCLDPWHRSYEGAPEDSRVWDEKNNENYYQNILDNISVLIKDARTHVLRGGSWFDNPRNCRSAFRLDNDYRVWRGFDNVGFRLVCPPQD
jgi:formylglycine-generating enzyme required for sulfatase activity